MIARSPLVDGDAIETDGLNELGMDCLHELAAQHAAHEQVAHDLDRAASRAAEPPTNMSPTSVIAVSVVHVVKSVRRNPSSS